MKQVVQPTGGGAIRVLDVPRPSIGATEVLVRTEASLISAGTELAMTKLAQSSLVQKARARPDLVRQVVQKAKSDGVGQTVKTVRNRLAGDTPLGYSACGTVIAVGEAVSGIRPGQRVATGGAGVANHAELQSVPSLLCSPVPDGVSAEEAAFSTVGSIALHGLRQADLGPGSKVAVIGLGLLGQLTARLAEASGLDVFGIDVGETAVKRARDAGITAQVDNGQSTTDAVLQWSRGRGADAVIICASSKSSAIALRAAELCRDRAVVVVVGDVGLDLERAPFYERELSIRFARSYGPGRYERSYEEWGVDYPAGYVRWTENRNFESILDLIASGRLVVKDLVTHHFGIAEADRAYELMSSGSEPYLGIVLTYPDSEPERPSVEKTSQQSGSGIGWIGAGNFSGGTLLPAFRDAGISDFVTVASARGLSAKRFADRHGFKGTSDDASEVINDPRVSTVVVSTPHSSHAELAAQALRAGKHVWVEKPLALSFEELEAVVEAEATSNGVLFVGHNRRFAPMVQTLASTFPVESGPVGITYRVNAGSIDPKHWYSDRREGGRLLGEVCHFIDTCTAIAASPVTEIAALPGGDGESALAPSFVLCLRHANGSVATISYLAGGPGTLGKEYVEVIGQGRYAVLDDFKTLTIDGKKVKDVEAGKGHLQAVSAFRDLIGGSPVDTSWVIDTARACLSAAAALGTR
ncbi:bi-domain-containing oxidoreductase [Janibacter melonis]|uniref:bi-domain-containing oxidoreductase n=1 Tax=Janibacter melonis TaxID=262209 RepID=UPI001E2A4A3C|nr:bi-domain-containing oxidoreductase [Janibacter melonis]MCB5990842.1 bi-domain-containing oxidoreductase [Janibacter melonis]